MQPRRGPVSDSEREVLKALWERGPCTAREIRELVAQEGRAWAHTTIVTLLTRLETKGYVERDKTAAAHVYRASLERRDVVRQRLKDLADEFCDGAASPLVLALVQGGRFTPAEIARFRELIDEKQAGGKRQDAGGKRRKDVGR